MDKDQFNQLISQWRERMKSMTPGQHRRQTGVCPTLASLEEWVRQEKSLSAPPAFLSHVRECLYCSKRSAHLKEALLGQAYELVNPPRVLAADVSLMEKTEYQTVKVKLTGEGYSTDHSCLARLDRENGGTLYLTWIIPPELRNFQESSLLFSGEPLARHLSHQSYIAESHDTVVVRIVGMRKDEAQTIQDFLLVLNF